MKVTLLWATPNAEKQILRMARVSSNNRDSDNTRLLGYLIRNKHWSPLEMANLCVEIEGPRAILRQIIRHRSFSYQEFSQRYASPSEESLTLTDARRQDLKNRQNSIDDLPEDVKNTWSEKQKEINELVLQNYEWAIENGIAKECARSIFPEDNTTSILCINGTLRSWIHYLELRTANGTQLEHQQIALKIKEIFCEQFPIIAKAVFQAL